MVNKSFLSQMKKGSYLLNLSRGPIVEDQSIIMENLLSNHLEGYGTDVWTQEPPLKKDKFYLSWLNNKDKLEGRIIVNPHTSYFSEEAIHECRTKACLTCLDIINNRFINNRIV